MNHPLPPRSNAARRGAFVAALVALAVPAFADIAHSHAEEDQLAAEAARLAPKWVAPKMAAGPITNNINAGAWGPVIAWTPHIPVTAAQLPDGRLLTFASNQRTTFPTGPEFTYAAAWDPVTGAFTEINNTRHDMFCGGTTLLPDGRFLVNGGRATTRLSSIFDWRTNAWSAVPDMNDPRWYNTALALPNGHVFTVSGSGGTNTAERWTGTAWTRLTGIDWTPIPLEPGFEANWHPFLALAPDGRLFHFGPTDTMHWVNPNGAGSLTTNGLTVPGTYFPKDSGWAMYDVGKIIVAGGAQAPDNGAGSNLVFHVDLNPATPAITTAASMALPRRFANSVILPNGEVMIIGGNSSGHKFSDNGSQLVPEIWNPATGQWRTVAPMAIPRNYHSCALLLPDGRVWAGGSGLGGNSADHRDAQVFTPQNLFNANGTLATRPVLTGGASVIGLGTVFQVTGTPGLTQFAFIKMSSMTHSMNTDLRRIPLPFTETSPGVYAITGQANVNVMTPGYWMLFGLDAQGVHSEAKIIRVDANSAVTIAAPGTQSNVLNEPLSTLFPASGPAGATLTWSATGLPAGLSINAANGTVSGTPTTLGASSVTISVTDGATNASTTFTWNIVPATIVRDFANFSNAGLITRSGSAVVSGSVLRLTSTTANQAGAAYLTEMLPVGPDTSFMSRSVFRMSGSADGGEGMTFTVQGLNVRAIGSPGTGLGYQNLTRAFTVELDTVQGSGDANANHVSIHFHGHSAVAQATTPAPFDLEDGNAHTLWIEYDGPANTVRVYLDAAVTTTRPSTPLLTLNNVDLADLVAARGWFGHTAATGTLTNNHDLESWNLWVNAFALPSPPTVANPGAQTTLVNAAVSLQMQGDDPNADILVFSATGLPTGLTINAASGLISGTPTALGTFNPTVTVNDGNGGTASAAFAWTINSTISIAPLAGAPAASGTNFSYTAQVTGGVGPLYSWNFGDGTPSTAWSSSPNVSHTFPGPGRYLVTLTARDGATEITRSFWQAVHAPLTARKPSASSSLAWENRATGNSRVWAVNPDNDSVSVFDAVTRARLAEIPVGVAPRCVAVAPDGRVWVTNTGSASLSIIDPATLAATQTLPLPRGSRPFGLAFDPTGAAAWVALENTGQVLKLDPSTGAQLASANVGLNVRHLSIDADGTRIYASRFITPPLPGEDTANVVTAGQGGEVVVLDANAALLSTVLLQHSDKPDGVLTGRGIPNYLGAPAISPDGLSAWVPSKQDNIKRGGLRDGQPLTHESAVRAIASRIVLATSAEDYAARVDFDNAGLPSALAFDPWGIFAFTALEGSRAIAVIDVWNKREILRFAAGRAPQGVLVSPDGRTLWTQNFMDRTLSVHDVGALIDGNEMPAPLVATLPTITTERLAANVLFGKQLFYDSKDNRLALQEYISCAGCHNDGDGDGRTWDFTAFGEGLRNTISLRGHGTHGALHWTGNFDEVQDFENQIVGFAGGTGLVGAPAHPPLGAPNAGRSADLDALAAYVQSLVQAGSSPARAVSTLPAAAVAGRTVFKNQNCANCHSGANFTNSAVGVFANVGTAKPASGQRLGGPLPGFDVPTLRGLFNTAPYLHDGSAPTLAAAVQAHQGVTLSATDLANLAAFLGNIDDEIVTAPVPLTLTLAGPSGTVAAPFTVTAAFSGNATGFAPGDIAVTNGTASALTGSGANYSFTVTPAATGVVAVSIAADRAQDGDGDGNIASNTLTVNYLAPNVPPGIALTSPANGAVFSAPATINLAANATDSDGSVVKVEFFAGATKLGEDTSAPFTFAWSGVATGSYALSARATDNSGATTSTDLVNVLVNEPGVPSGWTSQDVGAVGRVGRANYVDGMFTVQASGEDIWWNADQFHFVSQPWLGDGTIVARVASISQTNVWALGGVMFRESLAANSREVCMDVHSAMGHGFQWRETNGGPTAWVDGPNFNPPRWVKLQRAGNLFTGSMSADGVNWTVVGTRTVAMGSACYVGLAACASNNSALSTIVFTDVALTSPAPNAPPSVSLAANGGSFIAPATVQLDATASDSDGSVAKVEFFNGATKLGEDTVAPFAFTWANVSAGTYSLTARATDNLGAATTSSAVSVTVAPPPNVPPTVSLAANGGPWSAPATVNLAATANDSDGTVAKVEFFQGATKLGEDTSAPFTFAWTGVTAGSYALSAVATDNANATTSSAAVNITVTPAGTLPPGWTSADIGPTGAAGSASHTGGVYTVAGSGAAIGGTSDAFQFAAQAWTGDGEMIVRLASIDAVSAAAQAGVMFRETAAAGARHVFLHVTAGNGAALASRSATDGSTTTVPGAGITPPRWLRLVRSGNTFTGYLSLDGATWTQLGTATVAMNAAVQAGLAVCSAQTGALATATFDNFVLQTLPPVPQPPTVAITAPAAGATFTAPANISVEMSASDPDGTVAKVELFAGATKLGEDTTAPFAFAWNGVPEGSYTLTARATDNAGLTADSAPVSLIVNAAPGGLPAPWVAQDIGAVGRAGDATFASGAFTVKASGEDIYWAADQFRYVWQPWTGNGTITARVASVAQTNVWALGGVMFRESLAANSRNVLMDVHAAMGHGLQWRQNNGGGTNWIDGPDFAPPRWVRLTRSGNTFTGSISADGVTWTVVGTRDVAMPATIYVGLAACASNNATTTTVVFEQVTVAP